MKIKIQQETPNFIDFLVDNKLYIISKSDFQKAKEQLYYWCQNPRRSSFYCYLYNTIALADEFNRTLLLKSFPANVVYYELWYQRIEGARL
ncbi:hypothetical protein IJ531_05320 [bacterium]|nr:hypothetical protein [bacterium]